MWVGGGGGGGCDGRRFYFFPLMVSKDKSFSFSAHVEYQCITEYYLLRKRIEMIQSYFATLFFRRLSKRIITQVAAHNNFILGHVPSRVQIKHCELHPSRTLDVLQIFTSGNMIQPYAVLVRYRTYTYNNADLNWFLFTSVSFIRV